MTRAFFDELVGAVVQLCLFSFVPFVWWLIAGRKTGPFLGWIGMKRIAHTGKTVHTVLSVVVSATLYCALTYLCISLISDQITTAGSQFAGKGAAGIPMALAYGYIRTGLSEEVIFRGFVLKRVQNGFGFAVGNLVQAALFGLLHGIPFGLVTRNVLVVVLMTILPGAFGWYQGWLNEKRCGGSIVPSWLLHGTMNFLVTCLSL